MLRKHDDLDKFEIGDWCFVNNDTRIWLLCPSQVDEHGDLVNLPVHLSGTHSAASWEWDGNREAPTLSPSILNHGRAGEPARWHGFLRAGKLVTC